MIYENYLLHALLDINPGDIDDGNQIEYIQNYSTMVSKMTYGMLIKPQRLWKQKDIPQALSLCWNIHKLDNDTSHKITLFLSPYSRYNSTEVLQAIIKAAEKNPYNIFNTESFLSRLKVIDLPKFPVASPRKIWSRISNYTWKMGWEIAKDKMEIWNPLDEYGGYDTIICLDIDMFLQHPIHELFNLNYPAFTLHSAPKTLPESRINGGLMVIKPSQKYYQKLVKYGETQWNLYKNGDKDNDVFNEWKKGYFEQVYIGLALEFNKHNEEFIMLSYIYNQIIGWCYLVPDLDYVKIWHSTADINELKFMSSIRWKNESHRFEFDEKLVKQHAVNYRIHERLKNHDEKIERQIKKCRLEVYKRWFKHFDEIQDDIIEIVDILKPPLWRGKLIQRK